MDYSQHVSTRVTPQSEPIPGSSQIPNSAGGYGWTVDNWTKLDRFLVLGSEGGSYYASERDLTKQNCDSVLRCIQSDGPRAVNQILAVSKAGRAPKNDSALFALAMASAKGDAATRKMALTALPSVARIGTHLFHFLKFREAFGGWGRGMRRAVGAWYESKDIDALAYQAVKYRQRDGWSHRDALRLAHIKPQSPEYDRIYKWIVGRGDEGFVAPDGLPRIVAGFEAAQRAANAKDCAEIVSEYKLPHEAVPTQHKGSAEVWEALFDIGLPMTALIRNLGNLTRLCVLKPMADRTARAIGQIKNDEAIRKARVHPLSVLTALKTYAQGHGMRGGGEWSPIPQIVDALDRAFYIAFGNVEPTNKRILIGLDVSGSMGGMGGGWGGSGIAGSPLTPREAAAAMCLVTAATEPNYAIRAFSNRFMELPISPRERLDDVLQRTSNLPFAGTDCSLPMLWALQNKVGADTFIVYTDSETWAGQIHPSQAIAQYREKMGIAAKLIVVGMVANQFTIADPEDAGMMDVVGFDTATPNVMADFIRK